MVDITRRAVIPDQLLHYVKAVSGLQSRMAGSCVLHYGGGEGVLAAFPIHDPSDRPAAMAAIAEAQKFRDIDHLTIIAPFLPDNARLLQKDAWWGLPLPAPRPMAKTRNMLKRAARDCQITREDWSGAHTRLAEEFMARKENMDSGTRHIFAHLPQYLQSSPDAALFSARNAQGDLAAFAISDFSSFTTAFYMFACRSHAAPPGTADLLLQQIISAAAERGHRRINFGLGIDAGVEFFKKKWGAAMLFPHYEFELPQTKRGFFARIFGGK